MTDQNTQPSDDKPATAETHDAENSKEETQPEAPKAEEKKAEPQPEAKAEQEATEQIRSGYKVRVAQKITQGDKERIQNFEGIVIATSGKTPETKTMTVRKIAEGGVGVEKIFPLASPSVEKVEVLDKMNVRRSKLYYLRNSLQKFQKLRRKK